MGATELGMDEDWPLLPCHDALVADPAPNTSSVFLGPRQALLEAAPCAACHHSISQRAATASIVCDGCNSAYHLGCTSLRAVPSTMWYCNPCTRHIAARGAQEAAEDIALQRFLLQQYRPADPCLLVAF